MTRPIAIIVNQDNHTLPGSHWCAIFIDSRGSAVYFDSYGIPPMNPDIFQAIRRNSERYIWNESSLQQFHSKVCGQYCIAFLYHMERFNNLNSFLAKFSQEKMCNDIKVLKMFKERTQKYKKSILNFKNYFEFMYNKVKIGRGFQVQTCTPKYI